MEALILYFVLFFPSFSSGFSEGFSAPGETSGGGIASRIPEIISFSVVRELGRTLSYTIPSLALIWYLISDKKGVSALGSAKARREDIYSFSIGFPGLLLIGLGVSVLAHLFSDITGLGAPPIVEAPAGAPGWIVLFFSCAGTGYLEESFFRFYLLKKFEYQIPRTVLRVAFSTLLFAVCHVYEGPWGILNAVLAGVLLSVVFTRLNALHGIAWAHGMYNLFVYVVMSNPGA